LIQGRNLVVYPDTNMRLAVSRAVAIETPRGWRIGKDKQSHKIDVVVALAMAAHSAVSNQSSALDRWQRMDVAGLDAALTRYWLQQRYYGGGSMSSL
jgi:phage terminase large subunit-like protein